MFQAKSLTALLSVWLASLSTCAPVRKIGERMGWHHQKSSEQEMDIEPSRAQANAERLQEMIRVVLVQKSMDRQIFLGSLNALNQGASLEGIYNGLVHSAIYRNLEESRPGASQAALKEFAKLLGEFEAELSRPTSFSMFSARPLNLPVRPKGVEENAEDEIKEELEFSPKKKTAQADAASFVKIFSKASIYTLKRILGDEGLKVIAEKRAVPAELSKWYAKWVVGLAATKVDFGIERRNEANEALHFEWAKTATEDQLRWEVLNRIHRVLNQMERTQHP